MTQYCQGVATGAQTCPSSNTQHVGYPTGGAFAGVWVDESAAAPAQATGHQIGVEAVNAAGHFGNTTSTLNRNAQYVIISPHGTNPDNYKNSGFCAWHDYTGDATLSGGSVSSPYGALAFTNLPYLTDVGRSCGQNFVNAGTAGTLDGFSIVEGHEYAETITDQFPAGGWTDTSGAENGDKCAWLTTGAGRTQNITLTTGTFAVQGTWANDGNSGAGACEVSHPIITNGGGNTVTVTNPGNQTSTVGTAVSLQMQATDSASGQTLTYSATGLPAGLSINTSTGLISGTPTTAQTTSVTVTAKDSTGASGSASFSWTVNSASGCTAAQLLGNPGFETGSAAPWTASASNIIEPASAGEAAHGGSFVAWLGFGTATQAILGQQVALPTGCTSYTWSFWLHIDTTDTGTAQSAIVRVQVLSSTGALLKVLDSQTNLNAASGYQQHSYDLSAYAGQTVTVRLVATQQSTSAHTNFVVDDNALNVS
jgi:serine protease